MSQNTYPCCGANLLDNNGHSAYCRTRRMSDPIQPNPAREETARWIEEENKRGLDPVFEGFDVDY